MLAAESFLRSDCTRWPESGLCSLTGLEAIPYRQHSAFNLLLRTTKRQPAAIRCARRPAADWCARASQI